MKQPKNVLHLIGSSMWIELPAGLNKKEVKARIKRFTTNLSKSQSHIGFNPKAQSHAR